MESDHRIELARVIGQCDHPLLHSFECLQSCTWMSHHLLKRLLLRRRRYSTVVQASLTAVKKNLRELSEEKDGVQKTEATEEAPVPPC